jgi:uncharacterized protein YdeI (YjbR/CyaY-like superfamily)
MKDDRDKLPDILANLPILYFQSQKDWSIWLKKNHERSVGVWLRIAKKSSSDLSVTYAEALEAALCYGWIDGQKQRGDEKTWLQKFTPRGKKSIWSKINREKALALIDSGHMQPAGRRQIECARKDGRWEGAYDSSRTSVIPPDLQVALDKNPKAQAFFKALDCANRYAVLFRIQTVKKAETRARKIQQFVQMLERNERIHP